MHNVRPEDRINAASLFHLLSKAAALTTAISVIIPMMNILYNLDFALNHAESAINIIGINIAAVLTSPLYCLLLIVFVFEPVVFILKKKKT